MAESFPLQKTNFQDLVPKEPVETLYSTDEFEQARSDLTALDTSTAALSRIYNRWRLEKETQEEEVLPPTELNKRFPGLNEPFTSSMNIYLANDYAQNQYERIDLMKKMQFGPDTLTQKVKGWASNMWAHMTDPTNLLLGVGVGQFVGAGLFGVQMSARMGVGAAEATLGQAVTRAGVEGVISSAAAEIPIGIDAKQMNQEYGALNAFTNIAASTFGGMVISGAGQMLGRALKPKEMSVLHDTAMSNAEAGYPIDTAPVLTAMKNEDSLIKQSPQEVMSEAKDYASSKFTPENKVDFDPEVKRILEEPKSLDQMVDHTPEGFNAQISQTMQHIEKLKNEGSLSETSYTKLKENLKIIDEQSALKLEMKQAAFDCIAKGIV